MASGQYQQLRLHRLPVLREEVSQDPGDELRLSGIEVTRTQRVPRGSMVTGSLPGLHHAFGLRGRQPLLVSQLTLLLATSDRTRHLPGGVDTPGLHCCCHAGT